MYSVYNEKEHYLHSGYDFIPMKDGETWCIASTNIGGYQVLLGTYMNKYDAQKEIKELVNHFNSSSEIYRLKYNVLPEQTIRSNNIRMIKALAN